MYSINESGVEIKKLKGREYKIIGSADTVGCKNLNMLIGYFPAKKYARGHIHDVAEEIIYCNKGSGEVVINGKSEKIKPGTAVYIPPKSMHSVNNIGKEVIELICVFSPSIEVGKYQDYNNEWFLKFLYILKEN